jgi:hypothetical protein
MHAVERLKPAVMRRKKFWKHSFIDRSFDHTSNSLIIHEQISQPDYFVSLTCRIPGGVY